MIEHRRNRANVTVHSSANPAPELRSCPQCLEIGKGQGDQSEEMAFFCIGDPLKWSGPAPKTGRVACEKRACG